MPPKDAMAIAAAGAAASPVSLSNNSPLAKLSDAQVFSKDPEQYTDQDVAEVIARLTKTLARFRKARQDSQEIAEATAKMKATNTKVYNQDN